MPIPKSLTLLLFVLATTLLVNAQSYIPLFETPTAARKSNLQIDAFSNANRIQQLELNVAKVNGAVQLPTQVQFNLFTDQQLPVTLDKQPATYYHGLQVYRGRTNDANFAHVDHYRDVLVVTNPRTGKMAASIHTSTGKYQILPAANSNNYLVLDFSDHELACDDFYLKNEPTIAAAATKSGCNERDENGDYVLDLFVGFSPEAAFRVGDIDAYALLMAEEVNNGFANSEIEGVRVRLVGTGNKSEHVGVVTSVLGGVYNWYADELAATGADFVADVQVPTGGNKEAGGWAGVGGYSSVNSINGTTAVFRHEMGHNFGSSHCSPSNIAPYAAGYSNGNVSTHMCGNNVNFYSTPLVNDSEGTPLGDAATADNARLIRERAATMANRRRHTILFDANDVGCTNDLPNGRYYVQNVNSDLYLGTANNSNSNGTTTVQQSEQTTATQWDIFSVGEGKYVLRHVASGRELDVPGSSNMAGRDLIIWSRNPASRNHQFGITPAEVVNEYNLTAFNGQCVQVEDAGTTDETVVEQNVCATNANNRWRFVAVPDTDLFSVNVAVTNLACFGAENGAAQVNATGGSENYTYTWSDGDATTADRNNLTNGTYTVSVSDGSFTIPYTFVVRQPEAIKVAPSITTSSFENDGSISIVASNGAAPYTYLWNTGATTPDIENLTAAVYSVTVTDNAGCSITKNITVPCAQFTQVCDDGNPNTFGDYVDANCNCVGTELTCTDDLPLINLALNGVASQSSNGENSAKLAIDGNRDGVFSNGSVAQTGRDSTSWWEVDLLNSQDIQNIIISNRTDCCKGRLEKSYVFVSDSPFLATDITPQDILDRGVNYSFLIDNQPEPQVVIAPNTTGRYVRIHSTRKVNLSLAEVKIFGCPPFNPVAKTVTANPLGDNLWELRGSVEPGYNNLTSVSIEHGVNDFSNNSTIDISNFGNIAAFPVLTNVDLGNATTYQFRIKIVNAGETFYSTPYTFSVAQSICTPMVVNDFWYKRFNRVTYADFIYTDGGNVNYENKTELLLGTFDLGQTYDLTLQTPSSQWTNLSYVVYVDFNQDGDFTDVNETIGTSTPKGQTTTVSITIPTENVVVNQNLHIRIQGHEGGNISTCASPVGNYKDFSIRVNDGDCTGSGHLRSFYLDTDGDGFGDNGSVAVKRNCSVTTLAGYAANDADCVDNNNAINPAAFEICDDGIDNNCDGLTDFANVAADKSARQSSTGAGGNAARAVDGNTSGIWSAGSTTHTSGGENDTNPWWEVDLGESYDLTEIILWNRTDCCSGRLADFYVFLSDTPITEDNPAVLANDANVWNTYVESLTEASATLIPNATGRYLRVQINSAENSESILSLAEVQAFSCAGQAPALAVDWLDFSAENIDNQQVELNWSTANETGSDYFVIERSVDGKVFSAIGEVFAQGATNGEHRYTFVDDQPATGQNFYRVTEVSKTGANSSTPVRTVWIENTGSVETKVYPNPLHNGQQLTIDLGINTTTDNAFELRTLAGKLLQRETLSTARTEVALRDLPQGVYFYQIRDKNNVLISKGKIVKL